MSVRIVGHDYVRTLLIVTDKLSNWCRCLQYPITDRTCSVDKLSTSTARPRATQIRRREQHQTAGPRRRAPALPFVVALPSSCPRQAKTVERTTSFGTVPTALHRNINPESDFEIFKRNPLIFWACMFE